jgi:hypothetical protein
MDTLLPLGTPVHLDPRVEARLTDVRAGRVVGYGVVHPTAFRYHAPDSPPSTVVIVADDGGHIAVWGADRAIRERVQS